jgi:hypothetical protein
MIGKIAYQWSRAAGCASYQMKDPLNPDCRSDLLSPNRSVARIISDAPVGYSEHKNNKSLRFAELFYRLPLTSPLTSPYTSIIRLVASAHPSQMPYELFAPISIGLHSSICFSGHLCGLLGLSQMTTGTTYDSSCCIIKGTDLMSDVFGWITTFPSSEPELPEQNMVTIGLYNLPVHTKWTLKTR